MEREGKVWFYSRGGSPRCLNILRKNWLGEQKHTLDAKALAYFHGLAAQLNRLRKNSPWCLILGGAALQRCNNWLVFSAGFSRCGQIAAQKALFPQPVKSCPCQNRIGRDFSQAVKS